MNRWIFAGLMGVLAVATGCGDDSSTTGGGGSGGDGAGGATSTGEGGDGTGGDGTGGDGSGGNLLGGCGGPGECGADERCDFADGECGNGERGTCVPRQDVCSDTGSDRTCLCNGIVVDMGYTCDDTDADATGSCALPTDSFPCGDSVCEIGQGNYCSSTTDDTGGPPYTGCAQTGAPSCDVPTCACLGAEIDACGGTCEDGPLAPTIHCPGG